MKFSQFSIFFLEKKIIVSLSPRKDQPSLDKYLTSHGSMSRQHALFGRQTLKLHFILCFAVPFMVTPLATLN